MDNSASLTDAGICDNSSGVRFTESSRNSYFNLTLSHAECSALAYFSNLQSVVKPSGAAIEDLGNKGLIWLNSTGKWELTSVGKHVFNLVCMAEVDYYRTEVDMLVKSSFTSEVRNVGFTLTLSKAQVRALWEILNTSGSSADFETLEALIVKGLIVRMKDPGKPMVEITAPGSVILSILSYTGMRGE